MSGSSRFWRRVSGSVAPETTRNHNRSDYLDAFGHIDYRSCRCDGVISCLFWRLHQHIENSGEIATLLRKRKREKKPSFDWSKELISFLNFPNSGNTTPVVCGVEYFFYSFPRNLFGVTKLNNHRSMKYCNTSCTIIDFELILRRGRQDNRFPYGVQLRAD